MTLVDDKGGRGNLSGGKVIGVQEVNEFGGSGRGGGGGSETDIERCGTRSSLDHQKGGKGQLGGHISIERDRRERSNKTTHSL